MQNAKSIYYHYTINARNTNVDDIDICASNSILFDNPGDFKLESLELKNFSKQVSQKSITENSPFIKIKIKDKIKIVKKSCCWFLDESKAKISTDKLQRFITVNKTNKRKKVIQSSFKRNKNIFKLLFFLNKIKCVIK